jgi:signal transduction histidine kinase
MRAAPARGPSADLLRRTFQNRSGRVIALTRMVLATVFFLALWIDPDQPMRATALGYALLTGYMLVAAGLLILSWRNWWWDNRLAKPALLIDVYSFLAAVFVTEGASDDFTSPFLAFFAFLMLATTIRWDWRVTVLTGLIVTGLYLLVGSYIATLDPQFDIYRFGRRIIYMLVMTLILAWFGLQRREQSIERFVELPQEPGHPNTLLDQALRYACTRSGARSGVIAWAEHEEPNVQLRAYGFDLPAQSLGPEEFDSDSGFSRDVLLFDRRRSRGLVARRGERPQAVLGPIEDRLAEYCGIEEAIALPLTGLTGRGELLLFDINGVSADHVQLGALLTREITVAFDRQATLSLAGETALARMRDSLARDLHDSVAQSLAGTSLRLEGLRAWIRNGGDPEPEIDAIKHSLREEQRHVRSLIARLRLGDADQESVEAGTALRTLLTALSVQWGVAVRLTPPDSPIRIAGLLAHEGGQILREAVANAVRHGNASSIQVSLRASGGDLKMTIEDDGRGFADGDPGTRPWSIGERVDKLGGRLSVATGVKGTTLEIELPDAVSP